MGRLFNVLLPAGWVLLTGGCGSPAPGPAQTPSHTGRTAPPGHPPPLSPSPAAKRFVIAPELENILHVVNVRLNHPAGSYLEIQVTVENMTNARQKFNYHLEWFDEDGASLSPDSLEFFPWMLLPREVTSITVKATLPTAADFGIAFVPAR
jgi:uncharacterized protein YcfL